MTRCDRIVPRRASRCVACATSFRDRPELLQELIRSIALLLRACRSAAIAPAAALFGLCGAQTDLELTEIRTWYRDFRQERPWRRGCDRDRARPCDRATSFDRGLRLDALFHGDTWHPRRHSAATRCARSPSLSCLGPRAFIDRYLPNVSPIAQRQEPGARRRNWRR